MENSASPNVKRAELTRPPRIPTEKIETALFVALAGLVLFKGGPVILGIALGIGEMMMALTRL